MDLMIANQIKEETELSDLNYFREWLTFTTAVVVVATMGQKKYLIWMEIEIEAGNSTNFIDKQKANRKEKCMAESCVN